MKFSGKDAKHKQRKFDCLVERLGGECVECSSITNLEFHHKPSEKKEFTIASNLCRRLEVLIKEADKCILLCTICHKGHNDHSLLKPLKHGTDSCYCRGCRCISCREAHRVYQYNRTHKR